MPIDDISGSDTQGSIENCGLPQDEGMAAFRSAVFASMERIPDAAARRQGWFAHFNRTGERPPIFWCFNNWGEAVFLAHWLGSRQPLFAMHSLHGVLAGKSVKKLHTQPVAEVYAAELLRHCGGEPVVLGGNCQAAPIAEATAHVLIAASGKAPLLVTLEHQPFYCYPGSVLMLFGRDSLRFNPFLKGEAPVDEWRRKHLNPSWGIINGEHGRYFIEPAVHQLTAYLLEATDVFRRTGRFRSGQVVLDPVDSARAVR